MPPSIRNFIIAIVPLLLTSTVPISAQAPFRKLGEMELRVVGFAASLDPVNPVLPKATAAGVRVLVASGSRTLTSAEVVQLLGNNLSVEGVLSGPGLPSPIVLSTMTVADPLVLPIPPLERAGDYTLSNVRLIRDGGTFLDVLPVSVPVKVIDQVLVTSVKTRPLTLDELKQKGIVLESDDFLGFEFNIGLKLESKPITLSMPVVFNRAGVPVPQPLEPPGAPVRSGIVLPTILPMMLELSDGPADQPGPRKAPRLPNGEPIRIPSVIVIPGNVGFLKGFFSAQLFVANGAPVGSGLTVKDVTGTIALPLGADLARGTFNGVNDDPLSIAKRADGTYPEELPVRGVGPDGEADTPDDVAAMSPGQQGQAEFVLVGEREGFHEVKFDIAAVLEGLATGPVTVKGHAHGGVLVRNARFDMAFTLPSVVRSGEPFSAFVTVTNIGQGIGNKVNVALNQTSGSHIEFATRDGVTETGVREIATLQPGEAETLEFVLESDVTGAVVASYLKFDTVDAASGTLNFKLGVGERGVPLSPDTLVLPAAVDELPDGVVLAAMRVLGQAWSIAAAPAGTLPKTILRTDRGFVFQKALALAEAGLRVKLARAAGLPEGAAQQAAVRDLVFDFFGGHPLDPGFDQLLRTTSAGRKLAEAIAAALPVADATAFERDLAAIAASGPAFLSFATEGSSAVTLTDRLGRSTSSDAARPRDVPGVVLLSLTDGARLGVVLDPTSYPYTLTLSGAGTGAVTFVQPDGAPARAEWSSDGDGQIVLDPSAAVAVVGSGAVSVQPVVALPREGPALLGAMIIGPETLDGAGIFGFNVALLFDRIVDAASAAAPPSYQVPNNRMASVKRQLSGRLVFGSLDQPEGEHVATTITVRDIADGHGVVGPTAQVPLHSLLRDEGAIVTGRVLHADGSPVTSAVVVYSAATDDSCSANSGGLAAVPVGADGRYEFRWVRRQGCGRPFGMSTTDPSTGALRATSGVVRADGETIVQDIVLHGLGAVEGTVRNSAGSPVSGASVGVSSLADTQITRIAETNGSGRYRVTGMPVGLVSVKAAAGLTLGASSGRIDRAGTSATVDVRLEAETVSVTGTVRRLDMATGLFSPAAETLVVYYLAEGQFFQPMGIAYTAADGTYSMSGLPVGPFRITATIGTLTGQVTGQAVENAPVPPQHIVVNVPAPPQIGSVSGTVTLPSGEGAAGVIVSIDGRGVLTQAGGLFTIPGVALRPFEGRSVTATTRDGKRSGSTTVVVDRAEVSGVSVRLSGVGQAFFTLRDASGDVMAGHSVGLMGACDNPCGCRFAQTNSLGVVSFDGLPLGSASVKALFSGTSWVDEAIGTVSIMRDGDQASGNLRFPGVGVVSGRVLYPAPDPRGLHGAEVTLSARFYDEDSCSFLAGIAQRTRTDASGNFRFTGVNLGPVFVTVTHFGYPTAVSAGGNLVTNGQTLALELRAVDKTAGILSGRVFLPDGVTPAGAGVEVKVEGPTPEVIVSTLADGSYRFSRVLSQGPYTIQATDSLTGGVTRERVGLEANRDRTHDMRLRGRGTVRVHVVDGLGQPVPSALVRVHETDFPNGAYEAALEPQHDGVVDFARVMEGGFSVEVSDPQARGGRASGVMPKPGDVVHVTVSMTVTGTVTGVFSMPNGLGPIPFATVQLTSNGRVVGQATTQGPGSDAIGSYEFKFVPAGTVQVTAEDPLTARTGLAAGKIESESQPLVLDIVAASLGSVSGVVTSNAEPQPGATVNIVSGSYRAHTQTDEAGRYRMSGVPEGRVVVTASLNDGFLAGTASSTLKTEGETITVDVPLRNSGRLTGTVVRSTAAGPAVGQPSLVTVQVGGIGGALLTVFSDADSGYFEFAQVPSGEATLTAEVVGSEDRGRVTVQIPAGASVAADVTLNGVGTLHIVPRDGQDIEGTLTLTGSGAFPFGRWLPISSSGVTLTGLLAGPVSATLRTTGELGNLLFGTASGQIVAGEERTIEIATGPSSRVFGLVTRGSAPARGAEIQLLVASGTLIAAADFNGRFEISGVPTGTLSVRVFDPVTGGRARLDGLELASERDLGEIVLDDASPVVRLLTPDATTRATLGGPIAIELADAGSGVDTSTLFIGYQSYAYGRPSFTFEETADGKVIARVSLAPESVVIGKNTLRAIAKDNAGNTSAEAIVEWTVTGGTLTVTVRRGATPAPGVSVQVGSLAPGLTNEQGVYVQTGLRPGSYNVVAVDPDSGLSPIPAPSVTLFDGEQTATLDVSLPAFGRIRGRVVHAGQPVVGAATATVDLLGWGSTTTNADGDFDLGFRPLGSYSLHASLPNGDFGTGSAQLVSAGQIADVTITLNGVGSAEITVLASGAPMGVDNASMVAVAAAGPRTYTGKTGADGKLVLPHVRAGVLTVTATAPNGQTGEASAAIIANQLTPIAVTLKPVGTIVGTVFHHGRATAFDPAGSTVLVRLSGTKAATAPIAADGRFEFAAVPLGDFQLDVTLANGDGGRTTGTLLAAGSHQADLELNGVGTVTVTVVDAVGNGVHDADVTVITTAPPFVVQRSAKTDHGSVVLTDVLAGSLQIRASANGLTATTTKVLAAGGSVTADLQLEPVGRIFGRVLAPGGTGGVVGALVVVMGPSPHQMLSGSDGSFQFPDRRFGSYTLSVSVNGRLRARVDGVVIDAGAPEREQDVELMGIGTVAGLVTSSGAPVDGATVTVSVGGPFGGQWGPVPTLAGRYTIADVPVGSFTVAARKGEDAADGSGTISGHGVTVTVDLPLVSSRILLPLSVYDANGVTWNVYASGIALAGYDTGHPNGAASKTAPRLTLSSGAVSTTFVGPTPVPPNFQVLVPTEENKREVVLQQSGVAGLDVTRKVFVPALGYFGRYLELLTNPGDDTVTVDVRLDFGMETASALAQLVRPIETSSSDAAVDAADRWVVLADDSQRSVYGQFFSPLALAFAGDDAAAPSEVSYAGNALTVTWRGVAIAPHQTVGFLHAMSVQTDRARGSATAARLGGLPPELLEGMSVEEAQAVRNFEIAEDLRSPLAPLPSMDGMISGRVTAGDGVTPVPLHALFEVGSNIRSHSPHYGRVVGFHVQPNADGQFVLRSCLTCAGLGLTPIPRTDFDLTLTRLAFGQTIMATHPGTFPSTDTMDLTRLPGGIWRSSSTNAERYSLLSDLDLATTWRFGDGDAASAPYNRQPYVEIVFPADVNVDEVIVRGARAGGLWIITSARIEVRDAAGNVVWQDVPTLAGTNRDADIAVPHVRGRSVRFVSLVDSSSTPGLAELRVQGAPVGDQGPTGLSALGDLAFTGTGLVTGHVRRADGTPLGGGTVRLRKGASTYIYSVNVPKTGDDAGAFAHLILPPGDYEIEAVHELGTPAMTVPVTITADTATTQDLVFPALGHISGLLRTATGASAQGTLVLSGPISRTLSATGSYNFIDLPEGDYTLVATHQASGAKRTVTAHVTSGVTTTADIAFPAVGTVWVKATVSGQNLSGGKVYRRVRPEDPWVFAGSTNVSGELSIANVPGPEVWIRVEHPGSVHSFGEAQAFITVEAETVPVTIVVPGVGTVVGTVRALDGTPIAGAQVSALAVSDTTVLAAAVTSAVDGTFQLANVAAGALRVRAALAEPTSAGVATSTGELASVLASHGATLAVDPVVPIGVIEPDERQLWQFDATGGQSFNLVLVGRTTGSAPALSDPYLEVYGPSGALVASNDDRTTGDKNARVPLTVAETGTYVAVARAADAESGAYRLAYTGLGSPVAFRPFVGRSVTVQVTDQVTSQPVADATLHIHVTGAAGLAADERATTDAGGRYTFRGLPAGEYTLEMFDGTDVLQAELAGAIAEGADSTVALTRPGLSQVVVRARSGSAPVVSQSVKVTTDNPFPHAADGYNERSGQTGADGTFTVPSFPIGHVIATAVDSVTGATVEASGELIVGTSLELSLSLANGVISGQVFAADAITPLEGARVMLGAFGERTTDSGGNYRFDAVSPATFAATVSFGAHTLNATVTFNGGALARDFTMPVAIVMGRVLDGATGVVATVRGCGFGATCRSTTSDASGAYTLVDTPWRGTYVTVTASPTEEPRVAALASVFAPSAPATSTVNVVLPATGTVRGEVTDADGNPIAEGTVTLRHASSWTRTVAFEDGAFELRYVWPGEVTVEARDESGIPGVATGLLTAGQDLSLPVPLVRSAFVRGRLVDESGTLGLENRPVTLQSLSVPSLNGPTTWSMLGEVTEADGEFTVRIPAGLFRVLFNGEEGDDAGTTASAAEGTTTPAPADTTVLLVRGSHRRQPQSLDGSAGSYCSGCSGNEPAFVTSYGSFSNSEAFPRIVSPELSNRQLRSLLIAPTGLRIRQVQFVPASSAFARTLTLFTNVTDAPMELPVYSWVPARTSGLQVDVTSSGDTEVDAADSYFVAHAGDAAFAALWGGASVADGVNLFTTSEIDAYVEFYHSLTIPPGATRALLMFTIHRSEDDGTVLDQVRALADLSDPDALVGLSVAERAAIVNFAAPAVATITGTVRDANAAPLTNRFVQARQAGVVVAMAVTHPQDGTYSLGVPSLGSHVVEVLDETNTVVARATVDVPAVDLDFAVPLHGSVTVSVVRDGAVVPDVEVTIESDNPDAIADDAHRVRRTGPTGEIPVPMPVGHIVARVADTTDEGALLEGGSLALALTLPSAIGGALDVTVLDGSTRVSSANVLVVPLDAGEAETIRATADAEGRAQLSGLPAGRYDVIVSHPTENRPARQNATVVIGQTTPLSVVLSAPETTGTVLVRAFVEGPQPRGRAAGAQVGLVVDELWPHWSTAATLDANGEALFTGLPPGTLGLSTDVPYGLGWSNGTVIAGQTVTVELVVGEREWFPPFELTGTDGVPRFLYNDGLLTASSDNVCAPFCGSRAIVNGDWFPATPLLRPLLGRREGAIGPRHMSDLDVTRRAFVPSNGGFVRHLDVLENPTSQAITVSYFAMFQQEGVTALGTIATTASGDAGYTMADDYLITENVDWASRYIFVTSSPSARLRSSGASVWTENLTLSYGVEWNEVTVPAGGTAILMHFFAEVPAGDLAAARAKADSLRRLTDPEALAGLTAEEKAQIVNFALPTGITLTGTVRDAASTPAVGHVVQVRQGGEVVAMAVTADPTGAYELSVPAPGTYPLEVLDPTRVLLARRTAVAPGTNVDVTVPRHGLVSVSVLRGADPVSDVEVTLESDHPSALSEDAHRVLATDEGQVWTPMPIGSITARVTDPDTGIVVSTGGALAAGETLALTLELAPPIQVGALEVHGIVDSSGAEVPASGAVIELYQNGAYVGSTVLDAAGVGRFESVPVGGVEIRSGNPPAAYGWADAVIAPDQIATAILRIGDRVSFPIDLTGADGLPRFVFGDGAIAPASEAGDAESYACTPFCSSLASVNGEFFRKTRAARQITSEREVVVGPRVLSGVEVTRRSFVPATGGFMRLLDVLRNTTSTSLTVNYGTDVEHSAAVGEWAVVATSSGDTENTAQDDYLIVDNAAAGPSRFVFVTSNGALLNHPPGVTSPTFAEFSFDTSDAESSAYYGSGWSLTLQPGETRIIMQLAAEVPGGDLAAAQATAESLRQLTAIDVLAGLGPVEKAQIVNFQVAQ